MNIICWYGGGGGGRWQAALFLFAVWAGQDLECGSARGRRFSSFISSARRLEYLNYLESCFGWRAAGQESESASDKAVPGH